MKDQKMGRSSEGARRFLVEVSAEDLASELDGPEETLPKLRSSRLQRI